MDNNIGKTVSQNFLWRLFERFAAQGVSLVVSIVLARILEPSLYGIIAIVTIFTSIMQVFVDGGLGNALIQKENADDLDFSTVFYFNLIFCIGLYIVMFLLARPIANFFNMEDLVPITRVLSLTIVISGVKNIQQAYVSRNMIFKKFFFATLLGTIGAAFLGILLAIKGFGVWALVAQNLFNVFVDTIVLWITVKWKPKWMFSFSRLKDLFSYGWKLLVARLIDTVFEDLRSLIIGKMYTRSDLALYDRGKQIPSFFVNNINTAIDSVLFPAMSSVQSSIESIKSMTKRSIKVSSYVITPLLIGLVACGDSLVRVVLTDKWIECVPYMQIICVAMSLYPIHTANLNAIKAIGRSDVYLRLEIIRKMINIISLIVAMWFGVKAIAYSTLFNSCINIVINSWPNKKLLGYGIVEQLKDVLPAFFYSIFMGVCVYSLRYIISNIYLLLVIQIVSGIIVYLLLSIVTKNETFLYSLEIIKGLIVKKKRDKI